MIGSPRILMSLYSGRSQRQYMLWAVMSIFPMPKRILAGCIKGDRRPARSSCLLLIFAITRFLQEEYYRT